MGTVKIYPATQQQAQTITSKVDDLAQKIQPAGLNSIIIGVVDFVNGPIVISKGGLDGYARRITT